MKQQSAKSSSINDPSRLAPSEVIADSRPVGKGAARCQNRTPAGRRCHMPAANIDTPFCFQHARAHQKQKDAADLAASLTGQLTEFTSASDINQVLSNLLILLSQNRISPRRAAVLAYITNQLLRTLPAIQEELEAQSPEDAAAPVLIMDVPRPIRPQPGQPA